MPKKPQQQTKAIVATKAKTTAVAVAQGTKRAGATTPKQVYAPNGNCIVSHSEFIQDVATAATTSKIKLECNPQNGTLFTWLSAIATRFEMYRFRKLRFTFKPSCSTTTSGYIALGFDFDAYDEDPTKNVMLTWKYSAKSALWQTVTLDVSADSRISTPRYCNSTPSGDKRLDFLGNFYALTLSTAETLAGELFVDYVVELIQPSYRLPPVLFMGKGNNSNTVNDQWFENLVFNVGNLVHEVVSKNEIIIKQAGEFMINALTEGAAISDNIIYTLFQPAGAVGSDWTSSTYLQNRKDGAFANTSFFLEVKNPPVALRFNGGAPSPGIKQNVRIATYADLF